MVVPSTILLHKNFNLFSSGSQYDGVLIWSEEFHAPMQVSFLGTELL